MFTVIAFNEIGPGSASEPLLVTTLEEGTVYYKLFVTCGDKHSLICTDLPNFLYLSKVTE